MLKQLKRDLSEKIRNVAKQDQGFSLIELLVVVLIIGILAAIAIPIFLGQQDQAKDAAAKSDLGNAKIAMISYATDNGGSFEGADETTLAPYGYAASAGVIDFGITQSGSTFCLDATSASGKTFKVTESSGVAEGACQ